MKVLMIEHRKELAESISVCFQLRWPNVTFLSAPDGPKGIDLLETQAPDIIILDLGVPGLDAITVVGQVRLLSDVPIVVLSSGDDELRRVRALEAGADECINQPFSPIEFLARVNALLRRATMSGFRGKSLPSFASDGLMIDFTTREVSLAGQPVKLTPTEYNLLVYLVKNEGRVVPRSVLLEQVWGAGYTGDRHLLKKYISRIRRKLKDDAANPQIVVGERGVGYKLVRPK